MGYFRVALNLCFKPGLNIAIINYHVDFENYSHANKTHFYKKGSALSSRFESESQFGIGHFHDGDI